MAEPLTPDWLQLPCLPFREIMQYVASESLEDLSSCKLGCKKWNDQIIRHNILKQRMVKLKQCWDEGDPIYTKNVMNFDQKGFIHSFRSPEGLKCVANGDTYATFNPDSLVLLQGENYDRKWSLKYEKEEDEKIEHDSVQITKDVIAFVTRPRRRTVPDILGTRKLNVYDIKTHSKLMSHELKNENGKNNSVQTSDV